MIKLIEIGISMLVLMAGIKVGEFYGPSMLEVHLSDGVIKYIKINKNSSYSCPRNCSAMHYHDTMIDNKKSDISYNFYSSKDDGKLELNNQKVVKIFEIEEKNKKGKKKNTRITNKRKIDIGYFIDKYSL
tara:strand:+ start:211 stop:600 length:390 start_codon:yes stop_codon:yes gene_type:complete